ncbi:hypothetical protein BDR07DRAFT_1379658 [Suillus spraguei]|nr:hypothetical protein BDR07DRAFT_1379658 [Suillus spraguei]
MIDSQTWKISRPISPLRSMAHRQSSPVTLNRQRMATKRWLAKPGVRDTQNAKACARMASKKNTQHIPLVNPPMLDGLDGRDITPEVDDGSLLTMDNVIPCSCDSPTLQNIENMANCWQKGWIRERESENKWDHAYEKLLKEVKFFEVKVANSKTT